MILYEYVLSMLPWSRRDKNSFLKTKLTEYCMYVYFNTWLEVKSLYPRQYVH